MAVDKDVAFTLKAVINKQKNKVLFAEIDNDLANVLLGFMTLPLARIVQLLMNHYGENTPVIGSLNTLYNSVANLDSCYFESRDKKQRLLDPESAFEIKNRKLYGSVPTDVGEAFTGNFIAYSASFIITDDLRMTDNVCRTFLQILDYAEVAMEDFDGAETRTVAFGVDEIMDLLKGSLISHHPLTDIILGTNWMNPTPEISNSAGISLFDLIEEEATTPEPDNLHDSITEMSNDLFGNTRDWVYGDIYDQESLFTSMDDVWKQFFVDLRPKSYIVTDDLSVTPFSVCSTMSLFNQMKISPSDVEEFGVGIGYEEILNSNILKASLTSTSALTDGLLDIILKRGKKGKKKNIE